MYIFTDGSFSRKPPIGGFGAVITYDSREITLGSHSFECKNNNIAEVAAIAMSIKYIIDNNILSQTNHKVITIVSDSSYALRKITSNNPDSSDPFEKKCLEYINDFLINTNKKVNFFQIKGHVHDGNKLSYYNNIADSIAGDERLSALEQYNIKHRTKNKHKYLQDFKDHIR